jgi:hypothetical protein
MSKTALLAFAFIAAAVPYATSRTGVETGDLSVYVVSTLGGPLPAGTLSVRSESGDIVYSGAIKGQRTIRLPYGEYTISFDADFIEPVSRKVSIHGRERFLVLGTDMEQTVLDIPHGPVTVSVRVRPADACAPGNLLWAKLVGVFSDFAVEQRIGQGGYALFEPVQVGKYVLVVVDGDRIRAAQVLTTKGEVTTVQVALSACSQTSTK